MKLFEALNFYKNVLGADISKFQIEHGNWIESFELCSCRDYFKYLNMTVADIWLNSNMHYVFKVLTPGVEE